MDITTFIATVIATTVSPLISTLVSTIIPLFILPLMVGAMCLVAVRLTRGPHILDRVIALDFMTVVSVGLLGVYAIATDQQAYLDVAIVVALLGFLGTVGFAYYVEQRQKGRDL